MLGGPKRLLFIFALSVCATATCLAGDFEADADSKELDFDPGLAPQRNPFNFSVGVRGEYDDNSNTSETDPEDAWKVWLSPSIVYTAPLDNTFISFGLTYSAIFFVGGAAEERVNQQVNFITQISRTFNDRVSVDFRNRFRYSQEPEALGDLTVFEVDGSFFINTTSLQVGVEWTPLLGTTTYVDFAYYDYTQQQLGDTNNRIGVGVNHDFRFLVWPTVTLVAGGRWNGTYYLDDQRVNDRDFWNAGGNFGADWQALPNLTMGARAGFVFTESDLIEGVWNPAGSAYVNWEIGARSNLQFRFSQDVTPTDLAFEAAQFSSTATLAFVYEFTERLVGSLQGAARIGSFDEFLSPGATLNGFNPNFDEDIGSISASLSYAINRYFSTNVGYTYATRISPLPGREYDRNRVYVGATANF